MLKIYICNINDGNTRRKYFYQRKDRICGNKKTWERRTKTNFRKRERQFKNLGFRFYVFLSTKENIDEIIKKIGGD